MESKFRVVRILGSEVHILQLPDVVEAIQTWIEKHDGQSSYYEITGKLRFLNHSCRPNARLDGCKLIAIKTIMADSELTIDYGPGACACRRETEIEGHECPGQSKANAA